MAVNWIPLIGVLLGVDTLSPPDIVRDGIDELYHGEHFDDLLYSSHDTAIRNALLVLYSDQCKMNTDLLLRENTRQELPGSFFLAVMRHDLKSMRQNVWFDITYGSYDLAERYGVRPTSLCPCMIFIKAGEAKDTVHVCKKGISSPQSLKDWLWSEVSFNILVNNKHYSPIKVSFVGKGPKLQALFLPLNSAAKVQVYPSYSVFAHILENGDFLNAWLIRNNDTIEVAQSFNPDINEVSWDIDTRVETENAEDELRLFRESHASRHFTILTQPSRVHNFTAAGFTKTLIPQPVYQELVDIYKSHENTFKDEYYPTHYTFWNLDEVDIQQATLTAADAARLADRLRPDLERWCQCQLKQTTGEGIVTRIRRYPKFSRVRMHVDELESGHVIGAILHIARELEGDENWPLEVIDNQGRRHKIYMDPGEMVIFEASRLVHGRPSVFKGISYVNSFFYFMPREGWNNGEFHLPSRTEGKSKMSDRDLEEEKLEL